MTTDERSKSKKDVTESAGIGLAIGVGLGVALGFSIPSMRKSKSTNS